MDSTPLVMATWACCATSRATRFTRATADRLLPPEDALRAPPDEPRLDDFRAEDFRAADFLTAGFFIPPFRADFFIPPFRADFLAPARAFPRADVPRVVERPDLRADFRDLVAMGQMPRLNWTSP
jgi:hypothetical protein